MKKLIFLSVLAVSILFASCKKKATTEEDQPDPFKLEYSKLTTEQHKQEVEKSGIDFIKKINDLPDQKFVSGLSYLLKLNPEVSGNSDLFDRIITMSADSEDRNIKGLLDDIASTSGATSNNKLSNYYGIYTWNRAKKDWDESLSSNRLEIRYPSDSTKKVNNAIFTLSYLASKIKVDYKGEKGELPALISAVLKIDNNEELRLTSSYDYKPDGTPTKADLSLKLGVFTYKQLLKNDGTVASSEWSFLKSDEVLLALKLSATGNTTLDSSIADDDIIKNANASFEVMNIKLIGEIDIKGLNADKSADNLTDSLANIKRASQYNTYSKLVAVNKSTNTIIAKTDFVATSDHGYFSIEPRLIFKDDSKMSLDLFFKD
jgi:hypothetical protein